MGSMLTRDEIDCASGLAMGQASREATAPDVRNRQAAAAYLQASTVTDDPMTRQSLRRRAAALLNPAATSGARPSLARPPIPGLR
jgi:DNA-binding transcriptional regulator YbjK